MAATLDLLNNVLVGLRKERIADGTTTVTSAYHLLALQFLNTAKRAIEASWDWQALRNTVTVTLSAGTSEYALTEAGPADMDVGPRSRLLYERSTAFGNSESSTRYGVSLPQVFDVTDAAERRLTELGWEQIERLHFTDDDEQTDPTHFALRRTATGITLKVWPTPADQRTLKMRFVIPQADLASTSIDSDTLTIPADSAVWLRALVVANEERGEELSRPVTTIALEADNALADSISFERTDEDDTSFPE